MLEKEKSVLIVTDVQGKLAEAMHQREKLYKNLVIIIESVKLLDIPIFWIEFVERLEFFEGLL